MAGCITSQDIGSAEERRWIYHGAVAVKGKTRDVYPIDLSVIGSFQDRRRDVEYWQHYDSPLGGITLTGDGDVLTGLRFDGQTPVSSLLLSSSSPFSAPPSFGQEKTLPVFEQAKAWLDIYFSGQAPDFTPKLLLPTSPFRRDICRLLLSIPFGHTVTYGEIAAMIARERGLPAMSAQAVGGAVGHNPICLMIPCHRVVGKNGSLIGYAGGLERKACLLALEGLDMSKFFLPNKESVIKGR